MPKSFGLEVRDEESSTPLLCRRPARLHLEVVVMKGQLKRRRMFRRSAFYVVI
jgi:hypothetical protein